MANLLAAPDDLPIGAKVRLTTNNQKIIESTVVAPSGGGGAGVDSFEGRSGVVVSASGDYNSTEVDNLSVNPGGSVTDALNFLRALITGLTTGVSSFNLRVGAIVSAAGDYSTTLVTNTSAVLGATCTDALNNLQATIAGLVTGVSSFAGRVGAVMPAAADYSTTLVNNASTVPGVTCSDALNNLQASIGALVTGVSSFAGRGGAVVPVVGDYNSSQINNSSGVPGATSTDALNQLHAMGGWSANWGTVAAAASTAQRIYPRTQGALGAQFDAGCFVCPVAGTFTITMTFVCATPLLVDSVTISLRRNNVVVAGMSFVVPPNSVVPISITSAPIAVVKGDRFAVGNAQTAAEAQAAWNGCVSMVIGPP